MEAETALTGGLDDITITIQPGEEGSNPNFVVSRSTATANGTVSKPDKGTSPVAPKAQPQAVSTNAKHAEAKDAPEETEGPCGETLFNNSYTSKKTVANGAMNFALFMANVSQIKVLVKTPNEVRDSFYTALLILIGFSIFFQMVTGVVLIMLAMKKKKASRLNNAAVVLVMIITSVNLVISGVGVDYDTDAFQPHFVQLANGTLVATASGKAQLL